MNDAIALIMEDRGGVTVGTCQIRAEACVASSGVDRVVVRVLIGQSGRQILVCSACRDALVANGTWAMQMRPRSRGAELPESPK
ncbi:MAG TPA: hypothetical protein PKI03_25195 [Pseudomonadota bacterium]|nr:hypothetical protein [Pseudomonadota bacterium]